MDTVTNDLDPSAEARVTRGAGLLDAMRPGWRDLFKGHVIHMADGLDCVAGHVFSTWGGACRAIGEWLEPGRSYPWASDWTMTSYGFIVTDEYGTMDEVATNALLPLWQAEINRP